MQIEVVGAAESRPPGHWGCAVAFNGPYPTKFSGTASAMVISATTFSGGVTNGGDEWHYRWWHWDNVYRRHQQ
jgi:hypothetical protein